MNAHSLAGELHPPAVLLEPLPGKGVDRFEPGVVERGKDNTRVAGVDLSAEHLVKGVKVTFVKVNGLGQVNVVELLEVMPEGGIDLGQRVDWGKRKAVADTLLLRQLDRE